MIERLEAWWERFGETRTGRVVTHPAALLLSVLLAVALACAAVLVGFHSQSKQTSIARHEASVAVAKAEQSQAKQAAQDEAQRAATAKVAERTRLQLCALVRLNATYAVPPELAAGWTLFGTSPLLHCDPVKQPPA